MHRSVAREMAGKKLRAVKVQNGEHGFFVNTSSIVLLVNIINPVIPLRTVF